MLNLNQYFIELKKLGLSIDTVYDIGAHKGTWSLETKEQSLPDSNFILFEANADHAPFLQSTGFRYFTGVLGKPNQDTVLFYTNHGSTGDSYYKENSTHYSNSLPVLRPCYTLDQIIEHGKIPLPDLIKIDTQGSELDILKGSKKAMDSVKLVYTECPFICYNSNAPTLNEYIDFFRFYKMLPIGIFEVHHMDAIVIQIDVLFIKNELKEKFICTNNNLTVNLL